MFLLELPPLPRFATMHSLEISHCVPNDGFYDTFCDIMSFGTVLEEEENMEAFQG